MPLFLGVGARIAERLIALGYVRLDGKPDVRRFAMEKRYDKTLMYFWLRDRNTPMKDRERLARDLGVNSQWLLFGDAKKARVGIRKLGAALLALSVTTGSVEATLADDLCAWLYTSCALSALRCWLLGAGRTSPTRAWAPA